MNTSFLFGKYRQSAFKMGFFPMAAAICSLFCCLFAMDSPVMGQRTSDIPSQIGKRSVSPPSHLTDLTVQRVVAGEAHYQDSTLVIPMSVTVGNLGGATGAQISARASYQAGDRKQATAFLVTDGSVAMLKGIQVNSSGTLAGELRIVDPQQQLAGQTIRFSIQLDPNNQVRETNRRNNISATQQIVIPRKSGDAVRPARPNRVAGNSATSPTTQPTAPPLVAGNPSGAPDGRTSPRGPTGQSAEGKVNPPSNTRPAGPTGLIDNQQLANVYRANDGGAYYVRTLQNKVYIFGEHPGKEYAVVIEGTRNGQFITGQYWDVPKGKRANKGSVNIQVQSSGQRLVVQSSTGGFGINTLEPYAIQNNQLPIAKRRPGFQTTVVNDLDGAWRTGNTHLYICEVDGKIIGWQEPDFASGSKPTLTHVMIGARNNSGNVVMNAVSVPKGQHQSNANMTFVIDDAFHLRQLGGAKYIKDIMDFQEFAQEITFKLKNNCVGFGYAIAHEGKVVKSGGWGYRLRPQDGGPLSFDADTQKCDQSTSKTITAAAVMHLLHSKGLTIDDKIIDYLPQYWEKGPNTENLTFAHLMRHCSGLTDYSDPDEYQNLKKSIKTGPSNMNWIVPQYEYRNCNYAMFRIIIPYLHKPADMHNFEDNGLRGDSINERCSKRYRDYVRNNILLPAGLANPQAHYTSSNVAYSYNYLKQNVAGYQHQPDQLYEMGAGSWVLSAKDYAMFLAALETGKILPPAKVAEMKSKGLGMFTISSEIGTAYMHGGSIGGNHSDSYGHGRGARTHWMSFPNNVQVYITINSANNLGAAESSTERAEGLRDAFNASLHHNP